MYLDFYISQNKKGQTGGRTRDVNSRNGVLPLRTQPVVGGEPRHPLDDFFTTCHDPRASTLAPSPEPTFVCFLEHTTHIPWISGT